MRASHLFVALAVVSFPLAFAACGDDEATPGDPGTSEAGADVDVPDNTLPDSGFVPDTGSDVTVPPPPAARPCRPTLSGLVAWWPGDGTFADLAPNPANAVSSAGNEIGFFAGKVAGSYETLGQSWAEVADTAKLDLTAAFTLEAWVKFNALPAVDGATVVIVDKSTALGTDGYGLDVTFTGGGPKLRLRTGAGSVTSNVNLVDLDRWTHLAGTWDGAMARLYVDGVERGAGAAANPVANALALRIGADSAGGSILDGHLDEIAIHSRALTAMEIGETISHGRCKSPTCGSSAGTGGPPVAWWTADGIPTDRIGGHHGVEEGSFDYADGRVAGAFDLRTAGAYLEVADKDDLDFTATTPFTVEAWVNFPPPLGGSSKRIADKITFGGADGWMLDVLGSNVRFVVGDKTVTGTTALTANTWYHVAGVYDGAALRVYVNGAQDGMLAEVPTLAAGNAHPLRIGVDQAGGSQLDGFVDEIAIYRRAKAAAELAATHTLGAAGYCRQTGCEPSPEGIVGWWPGEANAKDIVGGRDGTAAGTVHFTPAVVGSGFSLGGVGHVTVPHSTALEPTAITIEAWILPMLPTGGVIVSKASAGVSQGYSFALTPAGQLSFTVGDGASQTIVTDGGEQGTASVPLAKWSHVAVKYDRTTNEVLMYLNGVELGEGLDVTRDMSPSGVPLTIGASGAGTQRFPGSIDEVTIWAEAIDEEAIVAHAAAGGGGRCKQ